jgi:hypothetical protein
VAPIALKIHQVVEQIGARGAQAESHERQQRLRQQVDLAQPVGGSKRQKHQNVLEPMVGAQRPEVEKRVRRRRLEHVLDLGRRAWVSLGAPMAPDHDRLAGRIPHRAIGAATAHVVEAASAELVDQPVPLALAFEVDDAVARQDLVEQTDVTRHRLGDPLVGRGREDEWRPPPPRRLEVLDQIAPVGQARHVRQRLLGQMPLQSSFAPGQPDRHDEQPQRPALGQHEQGFE